MLEGIANATVKEKSYADMLKNSQKKMKDDFGKTIKATLETSLKDHQGEIVEKTVMKHEADLYEKERRSRNIVISNVPESNKSDVKEKIEDDIIFIQDVIGIDRSTIVKASRAGSKKPNDSAESAVNRPRPLIVILQSPDLAKQSHKYGNGQRIIDNNNNAYWINPDYTQAERRANYEARKARKLRQRSPAGQNSSTPAPVVGN